MELYQQAAPGADLRRFPRDFPATTDNSGKTAGSIDGMGPEAAAAPPAPDRSNLQNGLTVREVLPELIGAASLRQVIIHVWGKDWTSGRRYQQAKSRLRAIVMEYADADAIAFIKQKHPNLFEE